MSSYIVAFAGAARAAQAIMSTGADPMTIKEYKFSINITADFEINNETDVAFNIWKVSVKNKLTIDYKKHWGVQIDCTIVPSYTIEGNV